MDKRYQVFVSSTYEDLRVERQEVMQALLELDCIPSGMELFPAANDDQWTLIKKVIDDCDYYVVIVGGRYGSTGADGKSYTQMEYEYAISRNKPTIAFLHKDPSSIPAAKTEESPDGKKKLENFRSLLKQKALKYWTSPPDLGSVVSRSIVKLIKSDPAVGWARADELVEDAAAQELLRLRKKIDELQLKLQQTSDQGPKGSDEFAQGEEKYTVYFAADWEEEDEEYNQRVAIPYTWDQIFKLLSPLMIDKATSSELAEALNRLSRSEVVELIKAANPIAKRIRAKVSGDSLRTIIVQFRALGLMAKDEQQRSLRDKQTYWTLTPFGDTVMTRLNAIPKSGAAR